MMPYTKGHMNRSKLKSFGKDVLGVIAIIGAALTAPIPGPGSLPLLILGLSLLATNHEWAERWMVRVKKNGGNLSNKIFGKTDSVRWAVDLIGVAFIALATLLITQFTRSVARTAAAYLIFLAIVLLLGNRERLQTLKRKLLRR